MAIGQSVGYVRVSSVDQNTARQLEGISLDRVFTEKASAKSTERPVLRDCVAYVREGDTLHVHSIDRLARNLVDLEQIIALLTDKGVSVYFHKERLSFSGSSDAMSRLILQVMGAFAQFERELINERRREGQALARAKGKHMGRPALLQPETIEQIRTRLAAGEKRMELAKEYGISRSTIYRL